VKLIELALAVSFVGGVAGCDSEGSQAAVESDAGAPDAPMDSSVLDAAPDGAFCMGPGSTHGFCADFDEGSYERVWDTILVGGNGRLTSDMTVSVSPPASVNMTTPQVQDGGEGLAALLLQLSPSPNEITLGFDVFVDQIGDGCDLAKIGNDSGYVALQLEKNGATIRGVLSEALPDGTFQTITFMPDVQAKVWIHLETQVIFGAASASASVRGASATLVDQFALASVRFGTTGFTSIGLDTGGSAPWSVNFDNVTLDRK
jgi:hypothetical protein